jgi:DNA-binding CsgD family transcriptional regulator
MALGLARDMAHPDQTLTLREMQVLNAMSDGLSTKVAARLLGVAVKTVESHKTRVFAKLGLHSQAQLVLKSARDSEAGRVSITLLDQPGIRNEIWPSGAIVNAWRTRKRPSLPPLTRS